MTVIDEERIRGVDPCVIGRNPHRVRCASRRSPPRRNTCEPTAHRRSHDRTRDRTVEVRTRHRLSTGLATGCEPGEAPWARRPSSPPRVERPSRQCVCHHREDDMTRVRSCPAMQTDHVGRNFDAAATSSSTVLAPQWRGEDERRFVSIAMRSCPRQCQNPSDAE